MSRTFYLSFYCQKYFPSRQFSFFCRDYLFHLVEKTVKIRLISRTVPRDRIPICLKQDPSLIVSPRIYVNYQARTLALTYKESLLLNDRERINGYNVHRRFRVLTPVRSMLGKRLSSTYIDVNKVTRANVSGRLDIGLLHVVLYTPGETAAIMIILPITVFYLIRPICSTFIASRSNEISPSDLHSSGQFSGVK